LQTPSAADVAAYYTAVDVRPNQLGGSDFLAMGNGQGMGLIRLRIPGEHNVRNALAALAVATTLKVDFDVIRRALAAFGGVGRRFQVVGEANRVTVIDDYAHHPTEIRATLAAARQRYPRRRLWAVWQPHTYSRTKTLLTEFAGSFGEADRVVVLDIYRSRERDTLGLTAAEVVAMIGQQHGSANHVSGLKEAAAYILDRVRPDDVILTLSAGDGNLVGQWVLEGLVGRDA
jgi:UDP-N-acetylmuramate--alanine ligase